MIELTRGLKQYRDVETFEEYEFTSCLAYEMAIRNNVVIELIKNSSGHDILFTEYLFGCEFWVNYHFFADKYSYIHDDFDGVDTSEPDTIFHPNNNFYIESSETEPGWYKHTVRSTGFYSSMSICEGSNAPEHNAIIPSFKRPRLEPYPVYRDADVSINFNLPLSEILAYIRHIYEAQASNKAVLPSPHELLRGELEKSGHKRKNGFTLSDWADVLFIYDYWEMYDDIKSDTEIVVGIIIELNEYHRNNGSVWRKYKGKTSADYLSDSTIRDYRKMMIDYIDNLRYKELVTGISSQN